MIEFNGPSPARAGEHQAVAEELTAVLYSERVQRFLTALQDIEASERDALLDRVLNGPPSMRIDLGLPPDIQIARRFVGGPDAEFAISKRARSGSLVTIFVTLTPDEKRQFREVIPWHGSEN